MHMKCLTALFYFLCFGIALHAQVNDTFSVYFPLRDARLTEKTRSTIDSLVFKAALTHWQKLVLLGYADNTGSSGYNDTLSLARARNVRSYLQELGFAEKDVTLCLGKGQVDRMKNSGGYPADRKVLIIVDRTTGVPAKMNTPIKVSPLATAKVNETIPLNNIFFQGGSDILLSRSIPVIDTLYRFLASNPTVRIEIIGNICCIGEPTGLDQPFADSYLSIVRARVIYDSLVHRGIAAKRLSYKGVGNANPKVYPEKTEEDAVRNRRVDIRILAR